MKFRDQSIVIRQEEAQAPAPKYQVNLLFEVLFALERSENKCQMSIYTVNRKYS